MVRNDCTWGRPGHTSLAGILTGCEGECEEGSEFKGWASSPLLRPAQGNGCQA